MAEQTGSEPRGEHGGGTRVEPDERERAAGEGTAAERTEPGAPIGRRETYRTLDEQHGRLSEAEERFERGRRTVGLFLGPALFLVMLALPFDLEAKQQTLAAILALVVVWWITEAIPIPVAGIIGVCLCVAMGVAESDEVFGSFSDSTIFLFIGSFIIAEAMLVHGLDRRFAYNILGLRAVGDSTYRIIIAFGVIGAVTSPFMSNTGAAAMMLPIALGIMASVGRLIIGQVEEDRPERLRFGAALMLVITYGITIGGLLLPIGSPPNLIGRGLIEEQTGEPITFFEWFLVALPIVLLMFLALIVVILFLNRPEVTRVEGVKEHIAEEKRKLGPLSRGERNTLLAFGIAVFLWMLPGIVGLFLGDDSDLYEALSDRWLDEGVVAIAAAALLFVLPVNWAERRFTLNWNQAARIDWGTILLFGSGIALGSLMQSTGLAKTVGEGLADTLNVSNLVAITIISVVIAVLISETTSNTASAAIVVPIAISISGAVGVDPVIPALAAIFGANYGFMLPVSTPPNAIVYSSGMIPITRMVKSGAVFDVIGAVLCVAGVAVMAKVVGLA
jgi:solute carrier family 13 (sodium-dependent dicarboxylate transporter), member 2/3/5